jgi:hypothetical protein
MNSYSPYSQAQVGEGMVWYPAEAIYTFLPSTYPECLCTATYWADIRGYRPYPWGKDSCEVNLSAGSWALTRKHNSCSIPAYLHRLVTDQRRSFLLYRHISRITWEVGGGEQRGVPLRSLLLFHVILCTSPLATHYVQ